MTTKANTYLSFYILIHTIRGLNAKQPNNIYNKFSLGFTLDLSKNMRCEHRLLTRFICLDELTVSVSPVLRSENMFYTINLLNGKK
jgi:hypothetical protein